MDTLIHDLQYGMRALQGARGFAIVAIRNSIGDQHQYRDLRVTFPSEEISIARKGREQNGHRRADRTVLITGGISGDLPLASAEIFKWLNI